MLHPATAPSEAKEETLVIVSNSNVTQGLPSVLPTITTQQATQPSETQDNTSVSVENKEDVASPEIAIATTQTSKMQDNTSVSVENKEDAASREIVPLEISADLEDEITHQLTERQPCWDLFCFRLKNCTCSSRYDGDEMSKHFVDVDDLILRKERMQLQAKLLQTTLSAKDKKASLWADAVLALTLQKVPNSNLCGKVYSHFTIVWAYRILQIVVMVYMAYQLLGNTISVALCNTSQNGSLYENTAGGPSTFGNILHLQKGNWDTELYACKSVQDILASSNDTEFDTEFDIEFDTEFDRGWARYPGMYATMRALRSYNSQFDTAFKESNIDPNFPGIKFNTTKFEITRNNYLLWYSTTRSKAPIAFEILMRLSAWVFIASTMTVLSLKFQKDDPMEVLFPPILYNKKEEEHLSFHFRHQPESIWNIILTGCTMLVYSFSLRWNLFNCLAHILLWGVFATFSTLVLGLWVQVRNVKTLANLLYEFCSTDEVKFGNSDRSDDDERNVIAGYDHWLEMYKTTIGAMHVWSWRVTPILGSFCVFWVLFTVNYIVHAIFVCRYLLFVYLFSFYWFINL